MAITVQPERGEILQALSAGSYSEIEPVNEKLYQA
jgi:hypothetical protein